MAYNTPGVYVEEIAALPPSIAGVATAVPAFIGYTQMAKSALGVDLTLKPTRLESMPDFEAMFGLADPEKKIAVAIVTNSSNVRTGATASLAEADRSKHMMWYALRMYFDNGGGPCYICSVGAYKDLALKDLEDGLAAVGREDEPTLIVFPEAQYLSAGDYKALHELALQQCADLQNRFVIMDMHDGTDAPDGSTLNNPAKPDIVTTTKNFRDKGAPTKNLKYGAVYAPNIETIVDFNIDSSATNVTVSGASHTLDSLKSSDDQAYNMAVAAIRNLTCKLPPAGAMAGLYAATDKARGVWKAPANVGVTNAVQPTIQISASEQDGMNVDPTAGKSVNAIRAFTGLGTLVWGARTLAGNDNEWRYINVRRLCIYLETSIRKATMQFVFEPNDANTWVKVKGMIENFLTTVWSQGGLMGAKAADAFNVAVSLGSTMTAQDILEGRMIVVVTICPPRPAEFIVLRFVQSMPVS